MRETYHNPYSIPCPVQSRTSEQEDADKSYDAALVAVAIALFARRIAIVPQADESVAYYTFGSAGHREVARGRTCGAQVESDVCEQTKALIFSHARLFLASK